MGAVRLPKILVLTIDDFVSAQGSTWRQVVHLHNVSTPPPAQGYSSTYLDMGFAVVRTGTRYPPEH